MTCQPLRKMFAVQFKGGVKSLFYKTWRAENVRSVFVINFVWQVYYQGSVSRSLQLATNRSRGNHYAPNAINS